MERLGNGVDGVRTMHSSAQAKKRPRRQSPLRELFRRSTRKRSPKLVEVKSAVAAQTKAPVVRPEPARPIRIGTQEISRGNVVWIAGPQYVDSVEQMLNIAGCLAQAGMPFIRARAYWASARQEDFERHLVAGIKVLKAAAKHFNLCVVSEVVSAQHVSLMEKYCDVLEIAPESIHDDKLLERVARSRAAVLLNRPATLSTEEYLQVISRIEQAGNRRILLAETLSNALNDSVLDLRSIIKLRRLTNYPMLVHCRLAADDFAFTEDLAAAAIAAGADGIIAELDPDAEVRVRPDGLAMELQGMMQRARALKYTLNALIHHKFNDGAQRAGQHSST